MADPRFFNKAGPFRLVDLAAAADAEISDQSKELVIHDVAPLSTAGAGHLSFLDNRAYLPQFRSTKAAACVVHPLHRDAAPPGVALLFSNDPYRAYARIASLFYPGSHLGPSVHPSAVLDSSASLGDGVVIEAGAVVGARVSIGAGTVIGPNAVIGTGVVLGRGCVVGANASVTHTVAGDKVIIYPGCRIGQDGFGFAMGAAGHLKVPQLGRVVIGDDVEIGANATIDRGSGPDTVIGSGCRIDNLVQIAHNVEVGAGSVIVSQVGISGSTKLGKGVVIGGQGGIAGHLVIGDGAQIAAQSGVMRDVDARAVVMGYPAKPIKEFWREVAALGKLISRRSS
ncbi:UDP-3-O-(3-hydroxymyristoyl)glucosamine N-acyltransferase [Haematospirillum sp. H1815]|uniref:UDP-3-O-(3-hydroxymyristoyl)glucosamine N-acyltransferase n=1 Tax=Haematospirillum sp. H1815 TaxID=2723108 RepID=UPI001438E4DD|nr:UDP-3-O-(3-hydroxymyristoyl)glucosamine N-acyltransferase [Haematospirillum sp. H1815]NKD76340.1 UDP-3-O-(3-hydroxymyristoyl)glucosamine N-acyltransferase [Haematospirillum sp. H1815]